MRFKGNIKGLDELQAEAEEFYIQRLIEAGEAAVKLAISNGNYQNITGNLRSSIGYIIAYDGEIIKEGGFHKIHGRGENMQKVEFTTRKGDHVSFWARGGAGDGSEGQRKGMELARQQISGTMGYAYFLVAGMEYASYVSRNGYDVTDSAKLELDRLI